MAIGTVKVWHDDRGYGFIARPDSAEATPDSLSLFTRFGGGR